MLVIISDLHLTDGTTGKTINASAFEDFQERLRDLAFDASTRAGGRYQPIQELELVLLGDIFDLARSIRWNDEPIGSPGYVRPWDNDLQCEMFTKKLDVITDGILAHNDKALAYLRSCSRDSALTVPPATAEGKPAMDASEETPVSVRIHYLVGNHDWFYHLPGPAHDGIRQKVSAAIGLSNPAGPFPRDPAKSSLLQELYARHHVFARHGDIFDPFCYEKERGRNAPALGDAIVVELINRFPLEVRRRMGERLPAAFQEGLAELANVRPSLMVPIWVYSLLQSAGLTEETSVEVRRIWNELAKEFLSLPFVQQHETFFPLDELDKLQIALRLTKGLSFDDLHRWARFVQKRFWPGHASFAGKAVKEPEFKDQKAQHIVYGHTHHHEVVPLHTSDHNGHPVNQIYFNSGTWHAIHELTRQSRRQHKFVHFNVMTYLAFFREDERSGRPFETWSGTLGA